MALTLLFATQSLAQTPPGQFTRYWRNFFDAKASWPTLRIAAAQGEYLYGMGVASLVGSTSLPGAIVGLGLMGQVGYNLNSAMAGVGLNPPEPPRITGIERTPQGVDVLFEAPLNARSDKHLFQLLHFENANAKPRLVDAARFYDFGAGDRMYLTDKNPPQSGMSFYVMTTTVRYDNDTLYELTHIMMPWWSIPLSGSNIAYFAWIGSSKFGFTSDYSAPAPYAAGARPTLGDVDAIAVSPETGDVYVSRPLTRQITKMASHGAVLGPEAAFVSIPYKEPGQKGLAVDITGNLYTDNSASDSQFGGRLFRFNGFTGGMEFTGTVNYFSQLLMFANPVAVASMVMAPDGQLYVYDAMNRTVKLVPVNTSWEAGRRVGQTFYQLGSEELGNVIDMEVRRESSQSNTLFILDGQGVTRVFSDQISGAKSAQRIPLE